MTKMVSTEKYYLAVRRWVEVRSERHFPNHITLSEFLGMRYPRPHDRYGFHLTEEAADKIEMLCSPHYRTMLLAYVARKEL